MIKYTLLFFLAFSVFQTSAQQYLVIKKRNAIRLVYEAGDHIKFRVKGEKHWRKQLIVGFLEDGVRFHYFDVELQDIEQIAIPREELNYGLPNVLIYAGIGFFVIDQFNQTVVNGEDFDPNEGTVIFAATGVAAGFLWKLLKRKKYNIDGSRFRLETTSFTP